MTLHEFANSERRPVIRQPDLLDLFEVFSVAGSDLRVSAGTVYAARTAGVHPTALAIQDAEEAAERVLRAIRAFKSVEG